MSSYTSVVLQMLMMRGFMRDDGQRGVTLRGIMRIEEPGLLPFIVFSQTFDSLFQVCSWRRGNLKIFMLVLN